MQVAAGGFGPGDMMGMRHAAVRALAAAAVGIAAARLGLLPSWAGFAFVLAGVGLARVSRGWSLFVAVAAAALVYGHARLPGVPDPRLYELSSFQGVIIEEPVDRDDAKFVLRLSRPADGKVIVWCRDVRQPPRVGDLVRVQRRISPFSSPRNPGSPDYDRVLAGRGIVGEANCRDSDVKVLRYGRGPALALGWLFSVRRYLGATAHKFLPAESAELLLGLLVGARRGLTPEMRQVFTDSGVVHILAVSGFNVGIVLAAFWLLLAVCGVRGWWRFGATAGVVICYVLLVGGQASVVRAGLMAMAALLSVPTQRKSEPLAGLAVAGFLLLLWDPNWLFDVGFQLSFAATLAIVLAAVRFEPLVRRVESRRLRNWVVWPLLIALAAQLVTAPLLLHHFSRVQMLTPLATILVGPMVVAATPLGFMVAIVNLVSSHVAGLFAETLRLLLVALLAVVRFFGNQYWAILEPGSASWLAVAWLYCLLFLAVNWNKGWARTGLRLGAAVGFNVLVWQSALHARVTQVTFLDPGKGDCVLIEDTLGRVSLVDAGISGQGVLRDFLRFRGIRQIDLAVVSHPDNDHYGGLLDLGPLVVRNLVVAASSGGSEYCGLLDRLRQRGTRLTVAGKGSSVSGLGDDLRFIWPEKQARALFRKSLLPSNAVSLVALYEHAGFRMLLTGDMDEPELISDQDVRAELLKSPHHGSKSGNAELLYDCVQPSYVVVMGRYPTPAGLETRLANYGERYVNTRQHGAWGIRFLRGKPVFGYLLSRL